MCSTPIQIQNPSKRFVSGISKQIFSVPCGKCKECIKKMQDDWFIRSVFETKRVEQKGGAVWFPTLTYNSENLPYWFDDEYDVRIPCFNKEHFKSFRNKLRVYLTRHGYNCKDENTIRYIYCCEYGGKYGRSHIHVLLYVPFHVPADLMRKLLQKCWIYGFVMWSKKGMIAQGLKASQYCMKYISKDINWMDKYNIQDYLDNLKSELLQSKNNETRYTTVKSKINAFRRCMPHHCQSMGFGVDGINYFKDENGTYDFEKCLDGRLDACELGLPPTKQGSSFKYNMPIYFIRKIFYYTDEYNLLRLNDFGLEVLKARFEMSIRRQHEKLTWYTQSLCCLGTRLSPLNLSDETIESIYNITSKLCNQERSLSIFNLVYRDVKIDSETLELLETLDVNEQREYLNYSSLTFMLRSKTLDCLPVDKIGNRKNFDVQETYAGLECYKDYLSVLLTIERYEAQIGELETQAYYQQRILESNLFGKESNYIIPTIY